MNTILDALYNGKIYPAEQIVSKDPEYHTINQKIGEEKKYFKNKLSKEDFNRLSALEDMYTESTSMEEIETFSYGFRLGTLIMIEVLKGNLIK